MLTMFCKENKIPVTETIMTALFNLNAMLNVDCMISSENNIIEPKSGVEFKQRPLRPKTEPENLTAFMSKIHTDNNFCNEQTVEKSSKLLRLLYDALNIGGCLEGLLTVETNNFIDHESVAEVESGRKRDISSTTNIAAVMPKKPKSNSPENSTNFLPANAPTPAPKLAAGVESHSEVLPGIDQFPDTKDMNTKSGANHSRQGGKLLDPFTEFVIFLVMFRSVGRNPADKSRFSMLVGVCPKTIDRIVDKFLLALSFIYKHMFPLPTMEEL